MRAGHLILAGALFGGGMLAVAEAQDGRPFEALRAALTSLSARVSTVEAQAQAIPGLSSAVTDVSARVATLEQQTQAIPGLSRGLADLSARVSTLEQQAQTVPGLKIVDADGQVIGRALFGSTTFAVMMVDGVAVAFQVADGGFRQTVGTSFWYQSKDCTGQAFLTTDTGVIRQAQVLGTSGIYAKGQFRQVQFGSRRGYPTGMCMSLSSSITGAELAGIDLSGYRAPFNVAE